MVLHIFMLWVILYVCGYCTTWRDSFTYMTRLVHVYVITHNVNMYSMYVGTAHVLYVCGYCVKSQIWHSLCLIVRLWVPFRLHVYVCKRERERERERDTHTHTLTHTLSFCSWNFCAPARKTKMVREKDFFLFERNIVFLGPLLLRASQKNITKTFSVYSKNEILLSKLQGSFEL